MPRPDRPSYTIEMLAGVAYGDVTELMAGDPGLLDDEVWRLFEVEGGGETSLANHEKFFNDRWGHFFRDLAARDPVMRERLLDVSLAALARDFSTYRAGWFSRFHESLAPTDEERAARSGAYLGLLRSRVGPTVSFAVAALTKVDRAGLLPADAVLDHVGPVLVEGSASAAKAGLGLVGRAGRGSPEAAGRAAVVASEAMAHESPGVQRAAIDLVAKLIHEPDAAVARAIQDRLPGVAASQRSTATALVARLGGGEAKPTIVGPDVGSSAGQPSRNASPTDPDRAIEPVTSLEGLVDLAVSVLETAEPADDIERLLDGIGRLAADRPESFARLTAALAKRARTILARDERCPLLGSDPVGDVAAVVLSWTSGEVVAPGPANRSVQAGAGAFLSARAREVADAAAPSRPFLSVAAPTHAGGWIIQRSSSRGSRRIRRHRGSISLQGCSGWRQTAATPHSGRHRASTARQARPSATRWVATRRSGRRQHGGWPRPE